MLQLVPMMDIPLRLFAIAVLFTLNIKIMYSRTSLLQLKRANLVLATVLPESWVLIGTETFKLGLLFASDPSNKLEVERVNFQPIRE